MGGARAVAGIVVALGCAVGAAHAGAAALPTTGCSALADPVVRSSDPRVEYATVDGDPVTILLPPGYATTGHAYPVLYLFHGAFDNYTQFTTVTDLVGFTGSLADAQRRARSPSANRRRS